MKRKWDAKGREVTSQENMGYRLRDEIASKVKGLRRAIRQASLPWSIAKQHLYTDKRVFLQVGEYVRRGTKLDEAGG